MKHLYWPDYIIIGTLIASSLLQLLGTHYYQALTTAAVAILFVIVQHFAGANEELRTENCRLRRALAPNHPSWGRP